MGSMVEEGTERGMLGEEIAKYLNQQHVYHMNKLETALEASYSSHSVSFGIKLMSKSTSLLPIAATGAITHPCHINMVSEERCLGR